MARAVLAGHPQGGGNMSVLYWLGLIIALGLFGYLLVALLYPERF
jgi:K+-transporting ATPase KdpF subunit